MIGSAPRGTHWVLIEHRGAWPVNGFDGLDLDSTVHAEVFAAAQALRARILLIRRPGRRTRSGPGTWAVMHLGGPGELRQIWGTWEQDVDLLAIPNALQRCHHHGQAEQTSEAGEGAAAVAPSAVPSDPVVLVCAHGQHDLCCAVRGRPVSAALSGRWPELVWECTHVGGDRFAANVLVVPDGVYYGNLDADSALATVEGHLAQQIGHQQLRGYTDLAPVEQVAVAAALEHNGPAGRFDYDVAATLYDDGVWRAQVTGSRPEQTTLDVELRGSRTEPHQLTCRGTGMVPAVEFTVLSVRPAIRQSG